MSIKYESLDSEVRAAMAAEVDRDCAEGSLYISARLTAEGASIWPDLLREAVESYDDAWIASAIREQNLMRDEEERKKPGGGVTIARVPRTAPQTLAEGEFNRFYARGLCVRVLQEGNSAVEVYRGKEVSTPRSQSEAMVGKHVSAEALLSDLRASPGVEPALGLPPGPNSGLTVRRV